MARVVRGVTFVSASAVVAAGLSAAPAQAASRVPAAAGAATAGGAASGLLQRPDLASAQALARHARARVEVLGERTETTATFVNPDGTVSLQVYGAPRWLNKGTRTVGGEQEAVWADVDTTLAAAEDGSLAPKSVSSGLTLSGGGGSVVASMTKDGRSISIGWPTGSVPKPAVSGSTATYAGFAQGVDLQVAATPSGLETTWVIASRPTSW
jgi:hypothetical protein